MTHEVEILRDPSERPKQSDAALWHCDVADLVAGLHQDILLDLIISSPPYNIGKIYETKVGLKEYEDWHHALIEPLVERLSPNGSICWQVGNFVEGGTIYPLDYIFHPIFHSLGLKLRNRIVWHFGHGLHQRRRFSGRYEIVLWYTKSDDYVFNLDAVRVPPKYPSKRAYRGPRAGKYSGHPLGKNPEDVWEVSDSPSDLWLIPNVKGGHVEKTEHPCQFPVGLVERLVLALTDPGATVFDPFAGTGSAGVAALLHGRKFLGCEIDDEYVEIARQRLNRTMTGDERFRSHAVPIYDHTRSKLSLPRETQTSSD